MILSCTARSRCSRCKFQVQVALTASHLSSFHRIIFIHKIGVGEELKDA